MRVTTKKEGSPGAAGYSQPLKIIMVFIFIVALGLQVAAAAELPANSVEVLNGTYVSGNIYSLQAQDGDSYTIAETIGVPGDRVRINWTQVGYSPGMSIIIYARYEGNPAHVLNCSIFNGVTWEQETRLPSDGFNYYSLSVSPQNIINGEVSVKFEHYNTGSAGHFLYLDQVILNSENAMTLLSWTELTYLIWLVFIILGYIIKKWELLALGSVLGFYLAVSSINSSFSLGLFLFGVNVWILFDALREA